MKRGLVFVALMALIFAAIYLHLNPETPASAIHSPAAPGSSANLTKSSSPAPVLAAPSAVAITPATSSTTNPAQAPVRAHEAGELKPDPSASTPVGPETALQNVQRAVRQYGQMFGGNPVGTNPEITSQLGGDNPKRINFLSPQPGMHLDASGELVDAWGTPYFFHQLSGSEMEIHSAGPDKIMWTSDDLVVK